MGEMFIVRDLEKCIKKLTRRGKKIIVFLDSPGTLAYRPNLMVTESPFVAVVIS